MNFIKVTNTNHNDENYGKTYTFTNIADYIKWDRDGFTELARDFGIETELTDEAIERLAYRVEDQLPSNFYAESDAQTYNFVDAKPLEISSEWGDFQAMYNLIGDTMLAMF